MFIDKVKITVKAGDGGNGAVSFHREKYVAAGGPDGGDGGKGGNIEFVVDDTLNTLIDFRHKRKYIAQNGEDGKINKMTGKSASALTIAVPRGTVITDAQTGKVIRDMSDTEKFIALKGGNGGWGNQHFATPTRQVPRFAKAGLPGEQRELILELKLIADVGLIGFPNVGKSTLITMVSAARPKIANYHFTTLTPHLGVVSVEEGKSFVMADIPGIIEGAADGVGLGHAFLRHIERCRLLLHIVDVSGSEGRDPVSDFDIINRELKNYSPALARCPQVVAANKTDLVQDDDQLNNFKAYVEGSGYTCFDISAATNKGLKSLIYKLYDRLALIEPVKVYEPELDLEEESRRGREFHTQITKTDGNEYLVEGDWIVSLMRNIDFGEQESVIYFQRRLREQGVFDKLEQMGVNEGDTICIYDFEYEYVR